MNDNQVKKMLFRTQEGKLVEITKYQFKNDKMYYAKLMSIHQEKTESNKQQKAKS